MVVVGERGDVDVARNAMGSVREKGRAGTRRGGGWSGQTQLACVDVIYMKKRKTTTKFVTLGNQSASESPHTTSSFLGLACGLGYVRQRKVPRARAASARTVTPQSCPFGSPAKPIPQVRG